jgi:hypothetical protein
VLSSITLQVTTLADSGPGTLRAAITQANSDRANEYVIDIAAPGTIALESALPDLNNQIDLEGLGAGTSTVQPDPALSPPVRIFTVDAGATVKIAGLRITGGDAGDNNNGGGIDNAGNLTISQSDVSYNSAGYGGGLANELGGTVTVSGSTFTGNVALFEGGGLLNFGTATVSDSGFTSNNSASGGGMANESGGTAAIINGTAFYNNLASSGGGLFNDGTATVSQGTFTGNFAFLRGGGLFNAGSATVSISSAFTRNTAILDGAGLMNSGTATISDSSFITNAAGAHGGGLASAGTATVRDNTFTGNSATQGGGIFNSGGLNRSGNNFSDNYPNDVFPPARRHPTHPSGRKVLPPRHHMTPCRHQLRRQTQEAPAHLDGRRHPL